MGGGEGEGGGHWPGMIPGSRSSKSRCNLPSQLNDLVFNRFGPLTIGIACCIICITGCLRLAEGKNLFNAERWSPVIRCNLQPTTYNPRNFVWPMFSVPAEFILHFYNAVWAYDRLGSGEINTLLYFRIWPWCRQKEIPAARRYKHQARIQI